MNNKNQLLLQKRSSDRRAYPNYWDISASGHISTGETSLDAAKKETKEELNLDLSKSVFEYLFTLEEHKILNNGAVEKEYMLVPHDEEYRKLFDYI